MINELTRIWSKRSNAFTACIMYFHKKTLRLDTLNLLFRLTYQPSTFLYDIRGYVCQWSISFQWWDVSKSFLLKYVRDKSITDFWASAVTTHPSYFRYFNCSIMMIFHTNIFKLFTWDFSQQASPSLWTIFKKRSWRYMY